MYIYVFVCIDLGTMYLFMIRCLYSVKDTAEGLGPYPAGAHAFVHIIWCIYVDLRMCVCARVPFVL